MLLCVNPSDERLFHQEATSPFQAGYTAVWPVMNFPCMTHRLDFQPPTPSLLPTLTSCPRGKKCWEEEVAIFLPHWILHMPQLKSINGEGERSGKCSGTVLVHWFKLWRDGPGISLVDCYTPHAEAQLFSDHCWHFGSSRRRLWLESE